jgi:hypothetical protein
MHLWLCAGWGGAAPCQLSAVRPISVLSGAFCCAFAVCGKATYGVSPHWLRDPAASPWDPALRAVLTPNVSSSIQVLLARVRGEELACEKDGWARQGLLLHFCLWLWTLADAEAVLHVRCAWRCCFHRGPSAEQSQASNSSRGLGSSLADTASWLLASNLALASQVRADRKGAVERASGRGVLCRVRRLWQWPKWCSCRAAADPRPVLMLSALLRTHPCALNRCTYVCPRPHDPILARAGEQRTREHK